MEASRDLLEFNLPEGAPRRLMVAAVECFSDSGYTATTTRDIAARAGMSPAALYIHFTSKQEVLYRISLAGHMSAFESLSPADEEELPEKRFAAAVGSFARWHAENHRVARVIQFELGHLSQENLEPVRKVRRKTSRKMEAEIKRGVEAGRFEVEGIRQTSLAVLSLHRHRTLVRRVTQEAHPGTDREVLREARTAPGRIQALTRSYAFPGPERQPGLIRFAK